MQQFQLTMEEAIFKMAQRRSGVRDFQSIADQLTISYISSMLRLSCSL